MEQTNGRKGRKEVDRKEGRDFVRKQKCDQTDKQVGMQSAEVSLKTPQIQLNP